jgi:hypothetical protein
MPDLILGPVLRYVSDTDATLWVETDAPCEVEVLGHRARTFDVHSHHYALVAVRGLEPASAYEYSVELDGETRWPEPDSPFPPSVIRTLDESGPVEVVFGSCRVALPNEPPYTLSKDEDPRGLEEDALRALALELIHGEREAPHLVLMLGDQVYVDEGSPQTREFIRSRRDTSVPPGEEVADFEEYTRLYWESWGEPVIRWLFSTVSTAMVIDDHDMHDDWKISRSWLDEMRNEPWWRERVLSGLVSYWVYQHIGNLSPDRLEEEEEFKAAVEADDAAAVLREFVEWVDGDGEGKVWSFKRDIGATRLIVVDDRTGRVLREDRRSIFDDHEWDWIQGEAKGDFDHVLFATTDPWLLTPAFHYLEAWSEAVCDGVWGGRAAEIGERIRRGVDFDHWSAFGMSFNRLTSLVEELSSGRRGAPPASISVLSGDVHHAYLAEAGFPRGAGVRTPVYQAVCSPFRNALDRHEREVIRLSLTRPASAFARMLARAAGVADPAIRWRFLQGPYFDNQVATMIIEGRGATIRLEKTEPHADRAGARLDVVFERRLA